MATAPYCKVETAQQKAKPGTRSKKMQTIPPNATPQQIVNITNNNFQFINDVLQRTTNDFNNFGDPSDKNTSSAAADHMIEVPGSRETKEVRVENPDNSDDFVTVKRIESMTFRDKKTKSTWVWKLGDE